MFVDCDAGRLGYGTELSYWGDVSADMPRGAPLYVMVGADTAEAEVQVKYRGSAAEVTGESVSQAVS